MKLVKVQLVGDDAQCWINPDHIIMVHEVYNSGQLEGTTVTLREQHSLYIKSSVADFMPVIRAAEQLGFEINHWPPTSWQGPPGS